MGLCALAFAWHLFRPKPLSAILVQPVRLYYGPCMDIHHHAGRTKVNFSRALLIFFSKVVLGPTQRVHPNLSEVPTVNGFALIRGKERPHPPRPIAGSPDAGRALPVCGFAYVETPSISKKLNHPPKNLQGLMSTGLVFA